MGRTKRGSEDKEFIDVSSHHNSEEGVEERLTHVKRGRRALISLEPQMYSK